jgi:hypothetical protein
MYFSSSRWKDNDGTLQIFEPRSKLKLTGRRRKINHPLRFSI